MSARRVRTGRPAGGRGAAQRRLRRVSLVVALALAMNLFSPVPGGSKSSASWSFSPWEWMRGLLVGSAQAATVPTPVQRSGTARGVATHVPAAATDAGRGTGRVPGKGKGELAQYQPHQAIGGTPQRRADKGDGSRSFDPKTSKRVASASSETQDVYANTDGTYTRRVHQGRVNFKAADGTWTPIDTTLKKRSDGRFAMAANDVQVDVAPSAADPALVTVGADAQHTVSFRLEGAAAVAPVVKGDTATYPGVFPGVDLVEMPTTTGVKESIVLHSASAGNSWLFGLSLKGLTPRMATDGSVQLVDTAGKVSQTIPRGFMEDSYVDPRSGERASSQAVTYSLETTTNGSPALRVSVDQAWLDDPARVFPVTVDPTQDVGTSTTTYVETQVPGPHNHANELKIGSWDGGPHRARSFLSFTGFGQYYAGMRMTSVTLSVFDSWATNCTSATSFQVGRISELWSVTGLADYPGPAIGGSATAPVSIGNWTGVAPAVACGNTAGDRAVGDYITTGPLNLDTFNGWIGGTVANYGLALFTSESNSNYWKIFASNSRSVTQPMLTVTYTPDVPPQVDSQYPPNNYQATTLTPELLGYGHDPDNAPNALQYQFVVYNSSNVKVAQSPLQTSGSWVVPSGKLTWGQTYFWTVQTFDGVSYSSTAPRWYALSTPVPQPLITSGLSQNADEHGYDPSRGNYTTSVTDVDIATVGPSLSVVRDYNSLDGRYRQVFGQGWSTVYDAKATEVFDTTGALQTVVITYPDGQDVAFGRNANGSFAPPPGRYARLAPISGGGYTLTDKNGTVYTFTLKGFFNEYKITGVADAAGRSETFTYSGTQVVQATAASGRHLYLSWTRPTGSLAGHVYRVTTDPATAGDAATASTWTYSYTGDRMSGVCSPTSSTACTGYTYADATLYPAAVLDAGPSSYWRLGEGAGAARAVSAVLANAGADNASYSGVTLGQAGSLPGSGATAAGFDGVGSRVNVLNRLALGATYQSISMRFKTTATNGVLFSYQSDTITKGTTAGNYTPALYVGNDGKLLGQFWTGNTATITTAGAVNDGAWHEVVLSGAGDTQWMYLDGNLVGTKAGQISLINASSAANVYIGTGFLGGAWPDQNRGSTSNTGYAMYFKGSISDVAFYDRPLTGTQVSALATAGRTSSGVLTTVTRPSGGAHAKIAYDTATSRVSQVTDEDGGVWKLGKPSVSGSSQVYASAVLGAGPQNYWRFGEDSATDAVNEVNGDTLTYTGGVALNTAGGPFSDATVAAFNGSTAYAKAAAPLVVDGPNQSISLWFRTTSINGVIASYHDAALSSGTASSYVPMLYVGNDGKLRGEYWDGAGQPITTSGTVTDGKWHHVALVAGATSQTLYLDNAVVGSRAGTAKFNVPTLGAHAEIGAGFISNGWPATTGKPAAVATYFNGAIGEVATFRSALSAAQVAEQYTAARASTGLTPATTVNVMDPGGKTLSYVSDTLNGERPLSRTDALGNSTQFGYDTSGFLHTVTDPNGNVVTSGHDVRGNTVSQVTCQDRSANKCSTVYYTYHPDATSTVLTPDPRNDVLLTVRDGRSASPTDNTYLTTYTYDANGNRTGVTTPAVSTGGAAAATRTVTTVYSDGKTTASVDGGIVPAGLPIKETTPGGAVTSFAYYTNGDLAQVTDPVGLVSKFTYDGQGRQVGETVISDAYPNGLTGTASYDKAGRLVAETSPGVTNRVSGAVHTARTTTAYDVDGNITAQTVTDTTGGDAPRTRSTTYDAHGHAASTTDATGAVTTFGYDVYGNRAKQVDPGGTETAYTHDAEGRLLTTTLVGYTGDPLNPSAATNLVESSRAYDPAGRLASITDAMGRTTVYTYTDNGLVASVTRRDVAPSTASFVLQANSYDAAGHLTSQTTNNGATTTTTTVDAAGRTTATTLDPTGLKRTSSFTYTADDELAGTKLTDASANWSTVSATYDAGGRPTSSSVTGSVSPGQTLTTRWVRDQRGLPKSETDPSGVVTDFVYDEAGKLAQRVEPAVNTETNGGTPVSTRPITATGYDTFGEVVETSDQNGNTTTYAYDAESRLTSTTLPTYTPAGATTAITATATRAYDSSGQVVSQTDPLGNTTTFSYDQLGDLVAVTDPNKGVTHTTYDTAGEPLSVVDASGAVSQATYDYLGRRITSTRQVRQPSAAAYTTTYGYAAAGGWLASVKTPAGVTTSSTYDAAGEPVKVVDGAGNATSFGYDFAGRKVRTTLPDGTSSQVSYDDAGHLVATTERDAAGAVLRTTSAVFDAAGNKTSAKDARGNTTTFTYDATGAVTGMVEPVDAATTVATSFGYDAAGHRTRFTDGRGNAWLSTYTTWGLPESQIEPPTQTYPNLVDRTFTATYDAAGRVKKTLAPGGATVTHTYDALGNLTGQTGAGAEAATTARAFGYDAVGRMTSASAPGGTNTFGYDDRGLLLSAAGPSGTSSFSWTPDGRMASRVDAAGTTSYTYDGAGRLSTLTDPITATTATYVYSNLSLPTQVSYGTGKNVRSYGYDALHRVTSDTVKTSAGAAVASIAYGYDLNDNLTSKTTTGVAGASANTYTYDAADRLASWNNGTTTVGYTYDAAGNLTQAGATKYTYNPKNQLINDGTYAYSYSKRGTLNQQKKGTTVVATATFDAFNQAITQGMRSYAYDALGRVLSASGDAAGTATLAYTGTGNTVASDGSATYAYDPADNLAAIGSAAGNVLALTDQHDDVVGQFTAGGAALSGSATYDPFGAVTATAGMVGNLGFQSGWTDPTTKRVNMGSRWYDPSLDRFISRDAVSRDAVPNSVAADRYVYVDQNPLGAVDPLGTRPSWSGMWSSVKSGLSAVGSGLSSAGSAISSGASSVWNNYVAPSFNWAYDNTTKLGGAVLRSVVRGGSTVAHKFADGAKRVWNSPVVKVVRQATARQVRKAVADVKTSVRVAQAGAGVLKRKVVELGRGAGKALQHHAGAIVSTVVSVAVFVGCEAAIGVPTAGVGAVVGAVGCGALAGAAGNAAGYLMDSAVGNTKFSWGGLGTSALEGGTSGALGGLLGGVGGKLISKLGSTAVGQMMSGAAARFGQTSAGRLAGRAGQALSRGVDRALAPARSVGTKIGNAIRGGGCPKPLAHSFAPATQVVMADGSTKPIGQIKLGERVLATDAATGKTEAKPVVALHHNLDRDLAEVTVRVPAPRVSVEQATRVQGEVLRPQPMRGGAQARAPNVVKAGAAVAVAGTVTVTVHTTWHHPFWNQTRGEWTDAADLKAGDTLHALGSDTAVVEAVRTWTGQATMNDLTVDDTHTYYVVTADTPVLVHNQNCPGLGLGLRKEGNLREVASGKGWTHFLDQSRDDALAGVREIAHEQPSRQIHVVMDGFRMSNGRPGTLQEVFEDFYKQGRPDQNWITTQREMNILGESVRLGNRTWDSITFWHRGKDVSAQLTQPDFAALRASG